MAVPYRHHFLLYSVPFFVDILNDKHQTVSTSSAAAKFVEFALYLVPEDMIKCVVLDKVLVSVGNSIGQKPLAWFIHCDSEVDAHHEVEYDEDDCDAEWDIRLLALIFHREEITDTCLQYVVSLLDLLRRGDQASGGGEKAICILAAM